MAASGTFSKTSFPFHEVIQERLWEVLKVLAHGSLPVQLIRYYIARPESLTELPSLSIRFGQLTAEVRVIGFAPNH